jgi:DNA polymerase-3 subunit delta
LNSLQDILKDIQERRFSPVYFLMGAESYFIDKIEKELYQSVLSEEEREFNQSILYGKDTTVDQILDAAKRFPMMAEYQLVIVREAQELLRVIDQLVSYVSNPQPSTVLVVCYKYKSIDKRKKLYKALQEHAVLFESKHLYENQVPDWIQRWVKNKNRIINLKASHLLVECLGTHLSAIEQSLEKLLLLVDHDHEITENHIEDHIGFSKDFNNFELRKALGTGNVAHAQRICHYFSLHPRQHPIIVTLSTLHLFFMQLLQYHGLENHNPNHVSRVLGIRPFVVKEYQVAAKRYPMKSISFIIDKIRIADMKCKGLGVGSISEKAVLRQLINDIGG